MGREERLPPWCYAEPTKSLIIKGLSKDIEEDTLMEWLKNLDEDVDIKDVRVIRDRLEGNSRGFAFIDFDTVINLDAKS